MKFNDLYNNICENIDIYYDEGLDLFCQYYKTNEQLMRFLLKYKSYIKHEDDINIFNQYIDILENEQYFKGRAHEILNWLSLVIPENITDDLKFVLLSLHSHICGIDGRDDEISFKVLNLKTSQINIQRFFIYKYQQKIVISKMIYKRNSLFAIYGYVLKYIGNGVEKAF